MLNTIFVTILSCLISFSGSDPIGIAPASECYGYPYGYRLPIDGDCTRYIECQYNSGTIMSCTISAPFFNRCTQNCENNQYVCNYYYCEGELTTTYYPTTTGYWWETTTRFSPPTVPSVTTPKPCNPECNSPIWNVPCECTERFQCIDGTCQCDETVQCPFDEADCAANCGCAERCSCDITIAGSWGCTCDWNVTCPITQDRCAAECGCNEKCYCISPDYCWCINEDSQCPFDDVNGECVKKCGCENNCYCTNGDGKDCYCHDWCQCVEPPRVCPFHPYNCPYECGCEERCICNGNMCQCNPDLWCWMFGKKDKVEHMSAKKEDKPAR